MSSAGLGPVMTTRDVVWEAQATMTSRRSGLPETHPEGRRRSRWWQPGLLHAAQRNVAGAIYGLILATSVIGVSREYALDNAGIAAATVLVTAGVFWIAHVYAGVLATGLRHRTTPTRADLRRALDEEWPLVQAGILPTAILLLGPLGLLADDTAYDLAIAVCLLELAATGVIMARVAGASGVVVAVSGAIALSFGLVVIGLKVIVH